MRKNPFAANRPHIEVGINQNNDIVIHTDNGYCFIHKDQVDDLIEALLACKEELEEIG